ncbi:hypothetical protein [Paenibacillus lautus]|uniref:Tubulin/FtsZ GTPase domain-containing protein n=1 Tax=Paenibacillus lautus TaxID=1401 RepID=A0A385TZW1_PAELA|nr:hypothetical protein [Paenibacillus lautus]AYB48042.1 hypothetical protein D5F53_32470 [Paenibacillus lautus]VTR56398.1 Plasmid replication protein RepX [Actinobacillus pleuropneumoniae]
MEMNLGFITLEGFMRRDDGNKKKLKFCFISCGQFGGRQGDELARLGHDVYALNTSESDLSDLKIVQNIIKLDGYNGAVKDIERGQAAIKDNRDKVLSLLSNSDVVDADFVFVIAGMGGGTGNAAAPIILSNLSRVRKPFNGKPSFGAIVSVPGSWEKRGIKKNARWGLSHIDELIKRNACGSVTIVDNEKLFTMTEGIFSDTETRLEWTDYGNSTLAALLTEVAFLTSLPSSKTFDEDELLDVLSTPGYYSSGKCYIYEDDSLEVNSLTSLIEKSFRESPTANDFDYELDAVNGFVAVIHPKHKNPIISDSEFRTLEERFGRFIANAEKPHSGLIDNSNWGTITSRGKHNEGERNKAILYTGVVCSALPDRIAKMLEEIDREEQELELKKNERKNKTALDLSAFKTIAKNEVATTKEPVNSEFDLFGDSNSKSNEKDDDDFML